MRASLGIAGWAAAIALLLSVCGPPTFCAEEADLQPYRCVFRINTSISAGDETPEEIAAKANELGMDVLVFSDQFMARAEWGVPGFRDVLKVVRERQSVRTYGPAEYLARLAKLQQQYPRMVIIPALDVAPYYCWQGSPLSRSRCIRHWSEQLTVIGLDSPEVVRRMPVTANPAAPRRWSLASLLRLSVILLVPIGLVLMRRGTVYYEDEQGNRVPIRDPPWRVLGVILVVLGALLTAGGWPFSRPAHWTQYHATDGPEPYQAYVDWLSKQKGAMAFWAHPEITHREEVSGVMLVTGPYLNHVETVRGAAGFAAIYGDVRTACKPGGMWDRTLTEYCKGTRASPLRVVGESDYHGGDLERVETVLVLPSLSRASVLEEGLRQGCSYARARGQDGWIEVRDFSVRASGGEGGGFLRTLRTESAELEVHVALRVHCASGAGHTLKLVIVRDGQPWQERNVGVKAGQTATDWEETLKSDRKSEGRSYYRLMVEGQGMGEVVTNPIFVLRGKEE